MQHQDFVGHFQTYQPVCDEDGGASRQQGAHSTQHLSFGQRVEIRRNFVQQENRRFFEQGTGNGKALTLTATQLQPLLSD